MVVAKRQRRERREKPRKIEQRNVQGPEWGPQVKQTALLASPIYIGQAQGEETKYITRGAKIEPLLWDQPTLMPRGVLSFACRIKLSCNWTVTLVCHFKSLLQRDGTKEITHSPNTRESNVKNICTETPNTMKYFWEFILKSWCKIMI